jgi:Carboxypeptidase regulatory-like domain
VCACSGAKQFRYAERSHSRSARWASTGATLSLKYTATGESRSVTVNATGLFEIAGLKPGEYRLEVRASGFANIERTVELEVGQHQSDNFVPSINGFNFNPPALGKTVVSYTAFDPHATAQYVQQWSGSLEKSLGHSTVLEVGYLGDRGYHLQRANLINNALPGPGLIQPRLPAGHHHRQHDLSGEYGQPSGEQRAELV